MGSKPFHFKRFSVSQDHSTHKVGTDGVLLGAWVGVGEEHRRILDVGTGSGVIALMLAQRSSADAQIDAIDIEIRDVEQARDNVRRSPWPSKVVVHHQALQAFSPPYTFDLIVSNPPYFTDSLLPPDPARTLARHTTQLSFPDLLTHAARILAPRGRLGLILPYTEGRRLTTLAADYGLWVHRFTAFHSRKEKPPERLLIELAKYEGPVEDNVLILYAQGEVWTEEYRRLTRDFYLKA